MELRTMNKLYVIVSLVLTSGTVFGSEMVQTDKQPAPRKSSSLRQEIADELPEQNKQLEYIRRMLKVGEQVVGKPGYEKAAEKLILVLFETLEAGNGTEDSKSSKSTWDGGYLDEDEYTTPKCDPWIIKKY